MVSKKPESKDKDKIAKRQQVLEKLQKKILEKLDQSDLDAIVKESGEELRQVFGEETLAISSNVTFTDNDEGQINLVLSVSSSEPAPPPFCPCGTGYFIKIKGILAMRDCPCP